MAKSVCSLMGSMVSSLNCEHVPQWCYTHAEILGHSRFETGEDLEVSGQDIHFFPGINKQIKIITVATFYYFFIFFYLSGFLYIVQAILELPM